MLQLIIFSISISIDALGYSMGFGSRNVRLTKLEFLLINILNILILSFFLNIFPSIKFLSQSQWLEEISKILLYIFGSYYILMALKELFFGGKKPFITNKCFVIKKTQSFLNFFDFLLLSIFLIENMFCAIVFYSTFSCAEIFVALIFLFHYLFFIIGFDLGNKIVNFISFDTSFISGVIFILLALFG